MTPFAAWLAMNVNGGPAVGRSGGQYRLCQERYQAEVMPEVDPEPVLIVPDTEENRRKLGMEEVKCPANPIT